MKDINEIIISGTINNVYDNNKEYIRFGLITNKGNNAKIYSGLDINRSLYELYKDFFVKGKYVFVKGYLNSYSSNNKLHSFITVVDISDNYNDIVKNKELTRISTSSDGVMIWNGERCEMKLASKEKQKEMNELLKDYR